LSIYSNVSLPNLKSVGGDLYIYSKLNIATERKLWKNNHKNRWHLSNNSSEWLLSREGNIVYQIENINFPKELFDKIRKDMLTAEEVFLIENIEQRRIAYQKMNKIKMKSLPNYQVLDAAVDNYKNKMEIVSFNISGYNSPFKYLHCVCPSTGREYFLETQQDKCLLAKAKSFGLEEIQFDAEW